MIIAYHYLDSFQQVKVSCRNIDIPLRYLCFCKFPTEIAETLISRWDIYVFVSFDHSIPLFGLISTSLEKWALFWRFCAETLISRWDIYVFVSFNHSIPLFGLTLISHWDIYVFVSFYSSIPLFGLISTSLEKRALFWRFRAETLISRSDIYVFVSFDHSIPLFGLILTRWENVFVSFPSIPLGFVQKRWYPTEIFMFL